MDTKEKVGPSCLEIKVSGKLVAVEQIQGKENKFYSNTIVIPASDPYSKPTRLVINSKLPFATEGTIVDTLAYVNPQWRNSNGKWFFGCNLWKDKPNF
jgi:hypothetical protein